MSNFITDCINGDSFHFDIDDYIDNWHDSNSELELHEYLGMTLKEYALYIEDDSYIPSIIKAHKDGVDITEIVNNHYSIAARAKNISKAQRLEKWLNENELW